MWNNKHKWIFVHPEKCGGVSIEQILRLHHKDGLIDIEKNTQHWNISQYIKEIGSENLNNYLIFGCIRNPWDRMVSLYYHAKKHDSYKEDFGEYVNMIDYEKKQMSAKYKFCLKGVNVMNFVAKIENFEEDVSKIMKKIGISDYILNKYDHSTDRPKTPYQEYYTKAARDIIEENFQWDIETFNYSFE